MGIVTVTLQVLLTVGGVAALYFTYRLWAEWPPER